MSLSLKCQYAVRAMFELARRQKDGLIRLREIAQTQHIPKRFLENILNELRQGGFVVSKRGKDGGFKLQRPPSEISVGDIIRFVEESVHPVGCVADHFCPLTGKCIFMGLWENARKAVEQVYDAKKFSDLVHDAAMAAPCGFLPVLSGERDPESAAHGQSEPET